MLHINNANICVQNVRLIHSCYPLVVGHQGSFYLTETLEHSGTKYWKYEGENEKIERNDTAKIEYRGGGAVTNW